MLYSPDTTLVKGLTSTCFNTSQKGGETPLLHRNGLDVSTVVFLRGPLVGSINERGTSVPVASTSTRGDVPFYSLDSYQGDVPSYSFDSYQGNVPSYNFDSYQGDVLSYSFDSYQGDIPCYSCDSHSGLFSNLDGPVLDLRSGFLRHS